MQHSITESTSTSSGGAQRPHMISLKRNISWALLGNAVYAASQWGMLSVLARVGNPELVGQFALALAITAPVVLFANLKLRAVQATDIDDEYSFGIYLALRLVTTPIALLIILGIVFLRFDRGLGVVILAMGIAKSIESMSDVLFGLLQKHERMDLIARSQVMKGVASLVAFALAVSLTEDLLFGIIAMTFVWSSVLIFYDVPNAVSVLRIEQREQERDTTVAIRPEWSVGRIASLARRALPLGLTVMLGSLITSIPQYVLEHFRGTYDIGLYAAMSYPLVAGSLVISAMGQSATPRLARRYAAHDLEGFRRLVLQLVGWGVLIGLVGVLVVLALGRYILTLLYGSAYAHQSSVFLLIVMAAAVGYGYVFLGTALSAMRRFDVQLPVTLVGAGILGGLCLVLVPSYGLMGIGFALLVTQIVQFGIYAFLVLPAAKPAYQN